MILPRKVSNESSIKQSFRVGHGTQKEREGSGATAIPSDDVRFSGRRAIAVAVKPVIAIIGVERGALRFQTVARSILGGPISSKVIGSCLSFLLPSS